MDIIPAYPFINFICPTEPCKAVCTFTEWEYTSYFLCRKSRQTSKHQGL